MQSTSSTSDLTSFSTCKQYRVDDVILLYCYPMVFVTRFGHTEKSRYCFQKSQIILHYIIPLFFFNKPFARDDGLIIISVQFQYIACGCPYILYFCTQVLYNIFIELTSCSIRVGILVRDYIILCRYCWCSKKKIYGIRWYQRLIIMIIIYSFQN